jgi:uncharacterized protein YjbI with pentapeptide repeats
MDELSLNQFEEKINEIAQGKIQNLNFSNFIILDDLEFLKGLNRVKFVSCIFKGTVNFNNIDFYNDVYFKSCVFERDFFFNNSRFPDTNWAGGKRSESSDVEFIDCTFHAGVDFSNIHFISKTRFHSVNFKGETDFSNAVFDNLADFWGSIFSAKLIFYRTNFFGTTIFSKAVFHENVLFTYSLIDNFIIFRGAKYFKGLDLSLSLLSGMLSAFDIILSDYEVKDDTDNEVEYEKMVTNQGIIPEKNKRETFRILKKQFASENNSIDSLRYLEYEHSTYKSQLKKNIKARRKYWKSVLDYCILWLNSASNRHGTSFFNGIIFTSLVGLLFFYFSLIATDEYYIGFDNFWVAVSDSVNYYANFMIPTHKLNYLDSANPNDWFYLWDFVGRSFVAYGIYQTIQAFRKFKG